jgi:hypothetical protein
MAGKVDGPAPEWASERGALLAKDHVEVWIAAAPNLDLPPVGWENQFGPAELESAQDCVKPTVLLEPTHAAECESWYAQQLRYRSLLRRLFVRQFVFTYQNTVEEFASPAYRELASNFFSDYVPASLESKLTGVPRMQPSIGPGFRTPYPNETGYEFQIYIPYEAFPPMRQLALQDLWVMVNVFSSARRGEKEGPYATSAPHGEWGHPSTFNHIRLDPPHRFLLTPCGVQLTEQDLYGKKYDAWFFPVQKQKFVSTDFILQNYEAGYEYWPTKPSPILHTVEHFWKELAGGGYVCGPELSYRKGDTKWERGEEVSETGFDTKVLPDGWTLVKSGPEAAHTRFGSGECGACPIARLQIWSIDPQGEPRRILNIDQMVHLPLTAEDLSLSEDWRRATLFRSTEDDPQDRNWASTSYCLQGHSYQKCGDKVNVKPPDPPAVPGLGRP